MEWFEVSRQRACGLMLLGRSSFYYRSRRKEHVALKMRLKDLALVRVRFGYLRLTVLLKREGSPVGKKLVYRLYRELGLEMRTKKRRKLASAHRGTARASQSPNETMVDGLYDRSLGERSLLPRLDRNRPVYPRVPQARRRRSYVGNTSGRMSGDGWQSGEATLSRSRWITGPSFARRRSTPGPIEKESGSISFGQVGRSKTD